MTAADKYLETITAEMTAREKLSAATAAYDTALAASEATLTRLRAEVGAQELELQTKADEAVLAAEEKAGRTREKAALEHGKRMAQIESRFDDDKQTARRKRDVDAYLSAVKQYETDKKTEEETYKARQQELETALKEQTDSIRDSQREQLQNAQTHAREAIKTEEQRWANEKALHQQAVDRARTDLTNALTAQEIVRGNALSREGVMIAQHYADTYANVDFWLTAIERRTATMNVPAAGQVQLPPATTPWLPPGGWGTNGAGGGSSGAARQPINLYVNGVLQRAEVIDITDDRIELTFDMARLGAA
jgi:hypothetical protein